LFKSTFLLRRAASAYILHNKHLIFSAVITELLQVTVSANCKTARCSTDTPKNGKAIPLQAWTGPEGSSRLRLPDFKTTDT